MFNEDDVYYCQLAWTKNIGSVTFRKLIARFKTAKNALQEIKKKLIHKKISPPEKKLVKETLIQAQNHQIHLIRLDKPYYPKNLKNIEDSPPILWAKGNIELARSNKKIIAIVGTRDASINGITIAKKIAHELSKKNFIIASGMAIGIDKAAHEGAIKELSIAVLPCGLTNIFPLKNQKIFEEVCQKGLAISAVRHDEHMFKYHFHQRNSILAGICDGILMVEGKVISGSMITVNAALNYGKLIFAIPGNPLDERYSGCNKIIKEGGKLAENAEDVIQGILYNKLSLSPQSEFFSEECIEMFDNIEESKDIITEVYDKISKTPTNIDDIIMNSNYCIAEINAALFELELDGKIIRVHGNRVQKY